MSMVAASLTGQVITWQSAKLRIPVYSGLWNSCLLHQEQGPKREKNPSVSSVRPLMLPCKVTHVTA